MEQYDWSIVENIHMRALSALSPLPYLKAFVDIWNPLLVPEISMSLSCWKNIFLAYKIAETERGFLCFWKRTSLLTNIIRCDEILELILEGHAHQFQESISTEMITQCCLQVEDISVASLVWNGYLIFFFLLENIIHNKLHNYFLAIVGFQPNPFVSSWNIPSFNKQQQSYLVAFKAIMLEVAISRKNARVSDKSLNGLVKTRSRVSELKRRSAKSVKTLPALESVAKLTLLCKDNCLFAEQRIETYT